MRQDRRPDELRPITLTTGVNAFAEGSALVHWGKTQVLATLTLENKLPPHLRNKKAREGWLTAEYAMLPRSTPERMQRERLYAGGRTLEIQRLIGRSLRGAVDLALFPGKTLLLDIDVLQADGGTRCAGILAGYAALHHAADRLIKSGTLSEWPLTVELAAVSVGRVGDQTLIDLEFSEDSEADLDLNVVATTSGEIIEVQGGAEGKPIPAELYVQLVAQGLGAVQDVLARVRGSL